MWQNWVNVVVGVLLVILPFVVALDPLKWISVIAGVIVVVLAYWANTQAQQKTGT